MFILDEIIPANDAGTWGFWAIDPLSPEHNDFKIDDPDNLALDHSSTKFMSYDGDDMDAFLVIDDQDWSKIAGLRGGVKHD